MTERERRCRRLVADRELCRELEGLVADPVSCRCDGRMSGPCGPCAGVSVSEWRRQLWFMRQRVRTEVKVFEHLGWLVP